MEMVSRSNLMFPRLYALIIPMMGVIALFIAGLQFWRSAEDFRRLGLVVVGMGIAVIGISYYNFRNAIAKLEGTIDGKLVERLFQAGNSMALFAYLICGFALVFSVHRH